MFHLFCSNANGGALFLLTDGAILMNECANGYGTRRWWKLTPDSTGGYVNGIWARVADSANGRKYVSSAVLADGRLLIIGGEYSDVSGTNAQDDAATGEIYDPVADSWSPLAPPPGITQVGDSPCCLLPDGRFLLGSFNSTSVFTFNPTNGTWSAVATKGDSGSEESWILMPEGTVLSPQCSSAPAAEKYDIQSNTWISAGTLVSNIVETASLEIGPGILLTDKRAFFIGAAGGVSAIYQEGRTSTSTGTWSAGPVIPKSASGQSQGSKDGPAVLLPSGTVLVPVAPVDGSRANYLSPCTFFEFDGKNLNPGTNPPNNNCPTYVGRLLLIPTGQAIWAREDDSSFYVFTETAAPQKFAAPVITSAPSSVAAGSTIAVSGRQFNGLSQAVGYGDDYTAATNYPLVRIRNRASGEVRYCRTSNHTIVDARGVTVPSMGVATGNATITTQVNVPSDLALGSSELVIVANGIPSDPVAINVIRG
ncbi:MAG: kelch repeat-containing protein [Verrucomicrobiota bacterium]